MLPKTRTHAFRGFRRIFLVAMSLFCSVGGSLRILNIALDPDIFPETSRHKKLEYDRIELFTS